MIVMLQEKNVRHFHLKRVQCDIIMLQLDEKHAIISVSIQMKGT